jgi:hypothetical protein
MIYEQLQSRYGHYIARRLQLELTASELARADIDNLIHYLEDRAEVAHRQYKQVVDNPLASLKASDDGVKKRDALYQIWHEAEELAYVIAIAENVHGNLQTVNAK